MLEVLHCNVNDGRAVGSRTCHWPTSAPKVGVDTVRIETDGYYTN